MLKSRILRDWFKIKRRIKLKKSHGWPHPPGYWRKNNVVCSCSTRGGSRFKNYRYSREGKKPREVDL